MNHGTFQCEVLTDTSTTSVSRLHPERREDDNNEGIQATKDRKKPDQDASAECHTCKQSGRIHLSNSSLDSHSEHIEVSTMMSIMPLVDDSLDDYSVDTMDDSASTVKISNSNHKWCHPHHRRSHQEYHRARGMKEASRWESFPSCRRMNLNAPPRRPITPPPTSFNDASTCGSSPRSNSHSQSDTQSTTKKHHAPPCCLRQESQGCLQPPRAPKRKTSLEAIKRPPFDTALLEPPHPILRLNISDDSSLGGKQQTTGPLRSSQAALRPPTRQPSFQT